eukprot:364724-Chlamydomonas_euryale.AAC.5
MSSWSRSCRPAALAPAAAASAPALRLGFRRRLWGSAVSQKPGLTQRRAAPPPPPNAPSPPPLSRLRRTAVALRSHRRGTSRKAAAGAVRCAPFTTATHGPNRFPAAAAAKQAHLARAGMCLSPRGGVRGRAERKPSLAAAGGKSGGPPDPLPSPLPTARDPPRGAAVWRVARLADSWRLRLDRSCAWVYRGEVAIGVGCCCCCGGGGRWEAVLAAAVVAARWSRRRRCVGGGDGDGLVAPCAVAPARSRIRSPTFTSS